MRLRAPTFDDAELFCALSRRRDLAEIGESEITVQGVRDFFAQDGFTLATDAIVAELPSGEPVGYATVGVYGSDGLVVPKAQGQGIGAALLAWVETRESELGRVHRHWYVSSNERAAEMLARAGYEPVRSYFRMTRALSDADRPVQLPDGVSLRGIDPAHDAAALHAVDDNSFSASPDYRPESLELFRTAHLETHDFDGGLSRVAERAGEIAGFLIARNVTAQRIGHVDVLAVAPSHQRLGIGRAMLLDAFAGFASAGLERAELGVASDNPRAMALYESAGMTPRYRRDTVERPGS